MIVNPLLDGSSCSIGPVIRKAAPVQHHPEPRQVRTDCLVADILLLHTFRMISLLSPRGDRLFDKSALEHSLELDIIPNCGEFS